MMSGEGSVALLSLIAGVIAAAFAWFQAVRAARIAADASETGERIRADSERLKVDNERRRRAFEIATEESRPVEGALDTAWNDMQTLKDFLSAAAAGITVSDAVVEQAADRLTVGYAQWGAKIPDTARAAWHSAKGSTGLALIAFRNLGAGVDVQNALSDLRETITLLTDRQSVIADERAKVRASTTKRTLDLL